MKACTGIKKISYQMQPQYLESSFIPNFLPISKAYENKT